MDANYQESLPKNGQDFFQGKSLLKLKNPLQRNNVTSVMSIIN